MRIELTVAEVAVIKKQLEGDYDPFGANESEMKAMNSVIEKAEKLMEELDAYDESGDDMISWFYEKYKEQNKLKLV